MRVRRQLLALVRDALFAAIMVTAKFMLAGLANVEMVSLLIMAYTTVYRVRALVPIYTFVLLDFVLFPSYVSLVMYLYVWLVLWGIVMLVPEKWQKTPTYMVISTLFGLVFGTLCAPVQAAFFGLTWQGTLAWILVGFPYDIIHAVGNAAMACLAVPLVRVLRQVQPK